MRRLIILLALAGVAGATAFDFVVLGDRTGTAHDSIFVRVLEEIRLLRPDFIVGTGDLIEGYTDDIGAAAAEWDRVLELLAATGVPGFYAPGNHDVWDAASESLFTARVNAPTRSLAHGNSFFIFADNSRWVSFSDWPEEQRRRFRAELGKARRYQHRFVLMHRPWWRYALEADRPDTLHEWLRAAGVGWVFTGHDHFYCSHVRDGINYSQVGPSGSRLKVHSDRGRGGFQNYLYGRVVGGRVSLTVVEPGRLYAPDVVTLGTVEALSRARDAGVQVDPFPLGPGQGRESRLRLALTDVAGEGQGGQMTWRTEGTHWHIQPDALSFLIEPDGRGEFDIIARLGDLDRPWPPPMLELPWRHSGGRVTEIEIPLPVKRRARAGAFDGPPGDTCWQAVLPLEHLAGNSLEPGAVEPAEIRVGFDSLNLYLSIRCHDTRPDLIRAEVTGRDEPVYGDDHVNIVFDPDPAATRAWAAQVAATGDSGLPSPPYYQLFVNPRGTIADRRCRFFGRRGERDWSWDGNWTVAADTTDPDGWSVTLACPLTEFGDVHPEEWGINAVRYQSRRRATGTWQPPFRHDPRTFGTLKR
ncbi:MAG TPA: hypothetical protein ENN51_05975 [candidate division WOR-3 bacterium]|uniref:Calcineurin-like phosphoesterase domain-containing protein n=1 Tax=candidate division WOR-3 bacterium TaxID=2052148 RepID=A0A7V0T6F6_UNCW3|nr:hypothetical protein [candidate division WOR-3 bacterium]